MKSISPMELKAMMDSGNEFQLIDIRDDYEYNICCIGGEKINMYSIFDKCFLLRVLHGIMCKNTNFIKPYLFLPA